ncbi:MAG: homocysteine S-methyltransferase family protein [Isosphaeraceae bacterium]
MNRLRALFDGPVVLADGAWGTQFQLRGLRPGEPADLWNLTRPDDVTAVGRAYVEAGSQVILTNTFRANPIALAAQNAADRMVPINVAGVSLSREAAGTRARVFASIGPSGVMLAAGEISPEDVEASFLAQAEALASAGPDALLLETFSDIDEARLALRAARSTGIPVLVSFAFDSGRGRDRTMTGATPEQVGEAMAEAGADGVGANCGNGPESFATVGRRLAASGLPLWLKPNAGLPVIEGTAVRYSMTADQFASYAPELVASGALFIGGCCGTNPSMICELGRAISSCVSS